MLRKGFNNFVLPLGSAACLALTGCANRWNLSKPPVPPRPVYVNVSALVLQHPSWRQRQRLQSDIEEVERASGVVPRMDPVPYGLSIAPPQPSRDAPPAASARRTRQLHTAHAQESQALEILRMELQQAIDDRVRSRRDALASLNKARFVVREEEVEQRYAEELAQLPARYAYAVGRIDLRLRTLKLSSDERAKLETERASLQDEWRGELSKLDKQKSLDLEGERQRLQQSLEKEMELLRKTLSAEAIQVLQEHRRHLTEDLSRSEREGPTAERVELPPVTRGREVKFHRPSREQIVESRRAAHNRTLNKAERELMSLREYVEKDTRQQVIAVLRKHRWTLARHPSSGIPNETRRVLQELRRHVWNQEDMQQ